CEHGRSPAARGGYAPTALRARSPTPCPRRASPWGGGPTLAATSAARLLRVRPRCRGRWSQVSPNHPYFMIKRNFLDTDLPDLDGQGNHLRGPQVWVLPGSIPLWLGVDENICQQTFNPRLIIDETDLLMTDHVRREISSSHQRSPTRSACS